jgi:hypothetical protein
MFNENLVIVGAFLQLLGSLPYITDAIKGKIQPNKVTWFLWSAAPLIAFSAQVSQGVGIQSLATFIVGFVPLIIFLTSFINKKATWKLGSLDIWCGSLSVIGLILWYITKVGNIAIFFAILADLLAAIPTVIKSYKEPETENHMVYTMGVLNAIIALLVIKTWSFQYWGFQLYLLFMNSVLALLVIYKIGKKISLPQ